MHTQPLQSIAQTMQISAQILSRIEERERSARLRGVLTELSLRDENVLFERTRIRTRESDIRLTLH